MKIINQYANGAITITFSHSIEFGTPTGAPTRTWIDGKLTAGPLGELLGEDPAPKEPTMMVAANPHPAHRAFPQGTTE